MRQEPVADLDDPALGVEVMQRAAAEDVPGFRIGCDQGQHAPAGDEHGQLRQELQHLLSGEVREIARFPCLGVRERRHDRVDVIGLRQAQDDAPRGCHRGGSASRRAGSGSPGTLIVCAILMLGVGQKAGVSL